MNAITRKIRRMLIQWGKRGYSATSINCGCCESFAWELEETFCRDENGKWNRKGKAIWGEDNPSLFKTDVDPTGHCFFGYGDKFYDSESPEGVDTPDELKYYQRILNLTDEWQPVEYAE